MISRFKLVPEYFPQSVGAVTGLVGAASGLGGFFPPLVLGTIKQATGSFTLGFILLSVLAVICLLVAFLTGKTGGKVGFFNPGTQRA
jgi:NNP family nitrate/nitrite transporter-like MFS transporter